MSNVTRLTDDRIKAELSSLPGWEMRDGKLHRKFEFPDFVSAFGFMAACAVFAEQIRHHPEWSNVYKTVTVDLTTHEVGGVSTRDLKMAAKMSHLAGRFPT